MLSKIENESIQIGDVIRIECSSGDFEGIVETMRESTKMKHGSKRKFVIRSNSDDAI
jgi:hypothetical protein